MSLGDSYASGPGIPTQVDLSCGRSDHNYAHLVATALAPSSFTDMTCGSATTDDMTRAQPGTDNPPQFDGLRSDTSLVTLTISGNDVKYGQDFATCAAMGAANPTGTPCTDYFTAGGTDQIAQSINNTAPKMAAVIQGIHQHSPNARVLVVGYLHILPETGSCYGPNNTISPGDYPYMNAKWQQVNQMVSDQAAANNATFVDTYTSSAGHDICKPAGTAWIEGLITPQVVSVHPNALGMQNDANQVLAALGA